MSKKSRAREITPERAIQLVENMRKYRRWYYRQPGVREKILERNRLYRKRVREAYIKAYEQGLVDEYGRPIDRYERKEKEQ